jgi:hypothetical protein
MEQYKRVHTRFAVGYRNEVAHDLLPAGTSVSTSAERLHAGLKSLFEFTEEVGNTKARTGRCPAGTRVSASVERLRVPAGLKSLFESAECGRVNHRGKDGHAGTGKNTTSIAISADYFVFASRRRPIKRERRSPRCPHNPLLPERKTHTLRHGRGSTRSTSHDSKRL